MAIPGSTTRFGLMGVFGMLACAVSSSCGGGEKVAEPQRVRPPLPQIERLDVAWSSTIVVPLHFFDTDKAAAAGRFAHVRLDDGRAVEVVVRTLVTAPGTLQAVPPTARAGWMPPVGRWSTREVKASERQEATDEATAGFAVFSVPSGAMGQGVWIGGRRVSPNWLASSRTIADRDPTMPWGSPLDERSRRSPGVVAAATDEAGNPFRRWRSRLALGTLLPRQEADEHPREADRFEDAALEVIAEQVEERWRVALGLLWADDKAVCQRVRRRLTLAAEVAGAIVPVWPVRQASLDDLLTQLLAPGLHKGERGRAAEQWLAFQPACAAWIASDAASVDARARLPVAEIEAVNLTDAARFVRLVAENSDLGADGGELSRVEPLRTIRLPLAPLPEYGVMPTRKARLQVGEWTTTIMVQGGLARAEPPGVLLGPMEPDRTLASLEPAASDESGGARPPAAVSLIRAAWATALGRKINEGWMLHVEFAGLSPELAAGAVGTPTLRVWTAASGRSRPTITIPTKDAGGPPSDIERGWAVEVPIVFDATADGVLLIGMDFTDAIGRHYAWPRPMFPWQAEPSRVAIDLSTWDGIGEAVASDRGALKPGS